MGKYIFRIGGKDYEVDVVKIENDIAKVIIDGKEVDVTIKQFGKKQDAPVRRAAVKKVERIVERTAPSIAQTPTAPASAGNNSQVRAPIPGVVLKVLVKEGDNVKAGQDIIVMEAMKMENQIQASASGVVAKVNVRVDDAVKQDDVLIEIDRA
jgi:biotin carboxyl carrier protein